MRSKRERRAFKELPLRTFQNSARGSNSFRVLFRVAGFHQVFFFLGDGDAFSRTIKINPRAREREREREKKTPLPPERTQDFHRRESVCDFIRTQRARRHARQRLISFLLTQKREIPPPFFGYRKKSKKIKL